MLKNNYALTHDSIFNCTILCNALCKRSEAGHCIPTPCCGDHHY